MTREEAARELGRRMTFADQLVAALQYHAEILWEPNPTEGRREGWAVCPCGCEERRLFISLPKEQVDG